MLKRKKDSKGSKKPAGAAAKPDKRKPSSKRVLKPRSSKPSKPSTRAASVRAAAEKHAPLLRRRASSPKRDLGIGPVDLEPKAGTPQTSGLIAARALLDKKATEVMLLDVRGVSGLCDEMLVATARSIPHLNALADDVEEALRQHGERAIHRDGRLAAEPDWLLLDFGDLMIHLFRAEARAAYRLEDYYEAANLVAKWKND